MCLASRLVLYGRTTGTGAKDFGQSGRQQIAAFLFQLFLVNKAADDYPSDIILRKNNVFSCIAAFSHAYFLGPLFHQ